MAVDEYRRYLNLSVELKRSKLSIFLIYLRGLITNSRESATFPVPPPR
jgi:hypothetical protein